MTRANPAKKLTQDSHLAALKVPPHSYELEQAVLGGLMLDNQAWDRIADRIQEQDFYKPEHRLIFTAIYELALRNSPFDVLTLAEALKTKALLEQVGGDLYLFELAKNTPSAANIGAYADIVREHSVLRQLISVAQNIVDSAFNPDGRDSAEILDTAERQVLSIAEQGHNASGPMHIREFAAKALERVDALHHSSQAYTGLPTGFKDLDELTSGLQPADLVIVAGRPSMGKTSFAMNIAEHAAIKDKKPVLIFSLEMPSGSLVLRMMSSLGRVDQNKVRTGKHLDERDWPRLSSAISMLAESSMFIDDTAGLSPSELRARARRVAREHGQLGLIVIDYLQLMQVPGNKENRTAEISEISRSLKALAKELNVPVIALSQLNRGLEQRNNRRPVMSDLRESGAIEQDADLILFIYRDEVYNKDSQDKGIAEILIAKQRNGPIGDVRLTFLGQYTRFENAAADQYVSENYA